MWRNNQKSVNILLVEDNPADTRLIKEIFKEFDVKNSLNICSDGVKALEFLTKNYNGKKASFPNLILLDLNLPRKGGLTLLKEIKSDDQLKKIPVIVLATSNVEEEISEVYGCHANCFITKPADYDSYSKVLTSIKDFWLNAVTLPI